ncbi:hypothetical protein SISSUDRAFT_383590 [Sistotremastrum suecicum HHB10207 ss-3]|uniref:Uncharacterized protein n=1 Tax=Sistotremastrum suecicum HHB10207 ss-3 TaxID=1314776 RepID=A0A166FUC5_9AGAM|nr:hypothetical protein SISSUDRAFT_383590 [Sistotremastrum suecicum HHB10207 ss-3]
MDSWRKTFVQCRPRSSLSTALAPARGSSASRQRVTDQSDVCPESDLGIGIRQANSGNLVLYPDVELIATIPSCSFSAVCAHSIATHALILHRPPRRGRFAHGFLLADRTPPECGR